MSWNDLRINKAQGFSLVETVVAAAISIFLLSACFGFFNFVLREVYVNESALSRGIQKSELKSYLENSCALSNSFVSPLNSLSCLASRSCTSGMTGDFTLVDEKGEVFNNPGITPFDGSYLSCPQGSEHCRHVLKSSYRVICGASDCTTPDISLQIRLYKVGENGVEEPAVDGFDTVTTYEPVYRSCSEALAAGQTLSDVYLIDPDGFGGVCAFPVYCQMSSSGYAKALIGRASVSPYSELPEIAPPLTPHDHGILEQSKLRALMEAPGFQKKMTVHLDMSQQGALTIPLLLSATQKNQHVADVSFCEPQNRNFVAATMTSLSQWKLGALRGQSFVGFSQQVDSGELIGFACMNCGTDYSCNLGGTSCCQKQLKGSLWIE